MAQQYSSLQNKAEEAYNSGNVEQALQLAQQALVKAEGEAGNESEAYATILKDVGVYQFEVGEYQQAIGNVSKAVELLAAENKVSKSYVTAISDLGVIKMMMGSATEAKALFDEALPLSEKVFGKGTEEYISALSNLAYASQILGNMEDAKKYFFDAIHITETTKGISTEVVSPLNYNVGNFYHDLGELQKAKEYYQQGYKAAKKASNKGLTAIGAQNLGTVYSDLYDNDKAEEYNVEARDLYESLYGKESTEYAAALNNLGSIYNRKYYYLKSELMLDQALQIKKQLLPEGHPSILTTMNNLANLYYECGRIGDATKTMEQVIKLCEGQEKEMPLQYALYQTNLASYYAASNDIVKMEKASQLILKAIDLYVAAVGNESPQLISVLFVAGNIMAHPFINDLKTTKQFYQRAVDILQKTDTGDKEDLTTALYNLSTVELAAGDIKNARQHYDEAMKLAKEVYESDNPDLLRMEYIESLFQREKKDYKTAAITVQKIMDKQEKLLAANFAFMGEEQRLQYYQDYKLNYFELCELAVDHGEKFPKLNEIAFNKGMQFKGMLFRVNRDLRKAFLEGKDPTLAAKFDEWVEQREYLARLSNLTEQEMLTLNRSRDKALAKADNLERELTRSAAFNKLNVVEKAPDYKAMQQKLTDEEVLVVMNRLPYINKENNKVSIEYVVYILDNAMSSPKVVMMDKGQEIDDDLIYDFNDSLKKGSYYSLAYANLWAPIEEHIGNKKTIWFWPDGMYTGINLNTIYTTREKYLIEEYDIRNILDYRPLMERDQKLLPPATAVLVGNPAYGYDVTASLPDDQLAAVMRGGRSAKARFSQLPGTEKEVDIVNNALQTADCQTRTLLGEEATEANVKTISNPDILHFATHGYYVTYNGIETVRSLNVRNRQAVNNPMFRSGLLLAGANYVYNDDYANLLDIEGYDDGVFTAFEAQGMNLQNTQLVTLSACQTGQGVTRVGEGITGLKKAFLQAGAKSVISSLWPVDDNSTKQLMTSFYSNWITSGDKHAAFRDAQLEVMQTYPQPFYWGAFTLIER